MRVRFLTFWKLFFDTLSSVLAGFQNDFANYEGKDKQKEFKKHRNSLASYPLHTLSPKLSGCCRKSQWLSWVSFLSSSPCTQTVPSDQLPPPVRPWKHQNLPLRFGPSFVIWGLTFPQMVSKTAETVMAVSSLLWTPSPTTSGMGLGLFQHLTV